MHATLHLLKRSRFPALERGVVETLQLNLGYRCNQTILEEHGYEDQAGFLAAHRGRRREGIESRRMNHRHPKENS